MATNLNRSSSTLTFSLITTLLFLAIFSRYDLPLLSNHISLAAAAGTSFFILATIWLYRPSIATKTASLITPLLLLAAWHFFAGISHSTLTAALYASFQIGAAVSLLLLGSEVTRHCFHYLRSSTVFTSCFFVACVLLTCLIAANHIAGLDLGNPNYTPILALFITIYAAIFFHWRLFLFTISVLVAPLLLISIAEGARGGLLGVLAAITTYNLWPFFAKTTLRLLVFAALHLSIMIGLTFLFAGVFFTAVLDPLEQFSQHLFGRHVYSGRDVLWPAMLIEISKQPVLGVSLDVSPGSVVDRGWSAHNLLLQLGWHSGLPGVLFYAWFMFQAFTTLGQSWSYDLSRTTAAYLSGVLIFTTFETGLLYNQFALTAPLWVLLGLTLARPSNRF